MKAAFTLALAAGVTSATSLRRSTADATQSAKLGVRDSSFLEALTSKYNCRDASASLEQTLSSVRAKNVQEETEREEQCNARTTQYTTPWTAAQANYDRDFPLVAPDEAEQERVKIENAHTSFNAAEDKLTKAVTDARDVVDTAQVDFESKKDTYDEKHGEHVSAVGSAADAETEWQTITKPAAELRINGAFSAAQGVADGELSGASIAANTAKTNGNTMCAGITAARSKHIDADELLLNKHIVPLLKELSESKCVDALTDANFEERKTAHAANSLLQEAMSSETKAKCALASSKARSFLETTHYLGSLPLDTQFDGNFQVFTDRVAEEKTHMNQLNDDCVQRVTDNFEAEMKSANDNHETAMRSATTAQTNAFESESKTYDGFTGTNNANVEKKAAAMVEPLRLKDAAHTALTLAKTKLTEKISTKDSVMEINKGTRDGIIRAAGTARLAQIEFRQNALNLLKTTAKEEFESNEKFVQEYCASAKEDLKKELDVLDKIDAKMLKLRVTNTAEVGKTDAETASLATFKAEDDARDEAARVEPARVREHHEEWNAVETTLALASDIEVTIVGDASSTLKVNSGAFPGEWGVLAEGVDQFSDRGYKLTDIPTELLGKRYFKGPCHSRVVSLTLTGHVTFLASLGNSEDSLVGLNENWINRPHSLTQYGDMKTGSFGTDGFDVLTVKKI